MKMLTLNYTTSPYANFGSIKKEGRSTGPSQVKTGGEISSLGQALDKALEQDRQAEARRNAQQQQQTQQPEQH